MSSKESMTRGLLILGAAAAMALAVLPGCELVPFDETLIPNGGEAGDDGASGDSAVSDSPNDAATDSPSDASPEGAADAFDGGADAPSKG